MDAQLARGGCVIIRAVMNDFTPEHGSARVRLLGWLALVPAAAVALLLIIPTQRPRPEYLYGISLPIVAAAAWRADSLLRRFALTERFQLWMPIVMLLTFLSYGTYYAPPPGHPPARPLLETVRRLEPYQDRISAPGTVFLAGQHAFSLDGYLVRPGVTPRPRVLGNEVLSRLDDSDSVEAFLDGFGVNLFYIDETSLKTFRSNTLRDGFLKNVGSNSWIALATSCAGQNDWTLMARTPVTRGISSPGRTHSLNLNR